MSASASTSSWGEYHLLGHTPQGMQAISRIQGMPVSYGGISATRL